MIKISIDEASVFDILSIYSIKNEMSDTEEKKNLSLRSFKILIKEIEEQIGKDLCENILNSAEYDELKKSNMRVFDSVEKAKLDLVKASDVDKHNHERYKCKQNIQKKFFGTTLSEVKIGYEKLKK